MKTSLSSFLPLGSNLVMVCVAMLAVGCGATRATSALEQSAGAQGSSDSREDLGRSSGQRYVYAHRVLPSRFFNSPEEFYDALQNHGNRYLRRIWDRVGDDFADPMSVDSGQLNVRKHEMDGREVFIITFPAPQRAPEAYFAAAVYVDKVPRRYLTLERGRDPMTGETLTMFGEWSPGEDRTWRHGNFGPGPAPTPDAFLDGVAALITDKAIVPLVGTDAGHSPSQALPSSPLKATVIMDQTLNGKNYALTASWLAYGIARAAWLDSRFLELFPDQPSYQYSFSEEVEARHLLLVAWRELSVKLASVDPYLDQLAAVEDAGFLREYIWVNLRSPQWKDLPDGLRLPEGLRLEEFRTWADENLREHQVQTRAGVKPRVDSNEPVIIIGRPPEQPRIGNSGAGDVIYHRKGVCYACHGPNGKGDGEAGARLSPPPADLTDPRFQESRTDSDLFRAIRDGVPGTGMISMNPSMINDNETWDVIAYIRSLNGT